MPPLPAIYDRLRAIELAAGSPQIADELLGLMRQDLIARQAELHGTLDREDWPQVRELAHRLRGSARYCAALHLETASEALQLSIDDHLPAETCRQAGKAVRDAVALFLDHTATPPADPPEG